MIEFASLLNELIMTDLTTGDDAETRYFMVHKGRLFVVDRDSKIDRAKATLKDHPEFRSIEDTDDVHEFLIAASEAGPDILVGEWYPEDKAVVIWNQSEIIPQTSIQVKKAVQALGAKKITFRYIDYVGGKDDAEKEISLKKITGEIPKKMYHGTSSRELSSILKYGLDPGRGPGRFGHRDVTHDEHVFLSATFEGALFYADNAVRIEKEKWNKYPIILEVEVPDPNLLAPDYDADVTAGQSEAERYYQFRTDNPNQLHTMKAMAASKETGKWGYKGRIPASFIKWVWYFNTYYKKWHKSRPDVWRKLLSNYDWETISYRLGMSDYLKPESYKNSRYWEE